MKVTKQTWRQVVGAPQDVPRLTLMIPTLVILTWGIGFQCPEDVFANKPNLVVINLDDADSSMLTDRTLQDRFPAMHDLALQGVQFTNCHVTTPLCGPSRAAFYRGQYTYQTGVRVQDLSSRNGNGFDGGFAEFQRRGYLDEELGTWMKSAGYHTIHVGKYLHPGFDGTLPPGWDEFYYSAGAKYFGFSHIRRMGEDLSDLTTASKDTYRTNEEGDFLIGRISRHFRSPQANRPLFAYWAPLAPHRESFDSPDGMIEPSKARWWRNIRLPLTSAFGEADVSDKPSWMSYLPGSSPSRIEYFTAYYRERLLAVRSVDDYILKIQHRLRVAGELENTVFIITSDNGYSMGEHRSEGKQIPFEEACHVPLIVSGKNVFRGAQANHLLAHIDITATLLDLAGVAPPGEMDGASFRSLTIDPLSVDASQWRDAVLIENWQRGTRNGREVSFAFSAIRMFDSVYVEWANGDREYYDLETDPNQLENQFAQLSESRRQILARLLRLQRFPETEPIVTLFDPHRQNQFIPSSYEFRGMSEDDEGVASVRVRIRDVSRNLYWNGSGWTSNRMRYRADLRNPGGVISEWSFPTNIPARSGTFEISAIGYDLDGNRTGRQTLRSFQFDRQPPETLLRIQTLPRSSNEEIVFLASATDNAEVSQGALLIRNSETGYFFDGELFQDQRVAIPFTLNQNNRARLAYRLPSGTYIARLLASDAAGNSDPSPSIVRFRIP